MPKPTRIALLISFPLLWGCSGITVSRDPERGFYRHVLSKDADTAARRAWAPLRDSTGRLVRSPASADSLAQAYRSASRKGRARLLSEPEENEESIRGTEAMDAYFRGAALVRQGRSEEALRSLEAARRLDTTLTYASDLDLWAAWAHRIAKDTVLAERRYRNFLERSAGLCPASANLGACDDSSRHAQFLDSLGAFGKAVGDSTYFANRHALAPNLRRDYYGIAQRRKEFSLSFLLTSWGMGVFTSVGRPLGERFEPQLFVGLFGGNDVNTLLGGDLATTLIADPNNRYGLKLRTGAYGVSGRFEGNDYQFLQARAGLEGSVSLDRNWLLFASMGKFYRDRSNPARFKTDSSGYSVWFENYIDVGATWFWSKNWGITAREFRMSPQIGVQGGGLFLGYDLGRKQLMITWARMENLL